MNLARITDILTRKNVSGYYHLYNQTQWYSKQQMDQFQLEKLKKLIGHCFGNVPYYREFMESNNIHPDSIQSLEDLQRFPIITKEIIKDNYTKFIPDNLTEIQGVKTKQTGGTTGNILFNRNDADTRSSTWGAFKRFEDWMGFTVKEKSLILMGGHVIGSHLKDKLKKKMIALLTNRINSSPYDTSEQNIQSIIQTLKTKRIAFIRSYAQFLFSLARRLQSEGLTFSIKSVSTTAEPLTAEHRALFKEVFHAEVFDQYGFGEIGGVAFECEKHQGLHITEERVIVEVNRNNELIVTDLDNYSMPFIRYWNADQAIISEDECSCGRKSTLIKEIMGRTCDYITGVNGEFLHWAYFWHLFFDSEIAEKRNLRKFQVRQTANDTLLIRLVCDPISKDEKSILVSNIQSRTGPMNVVFSFEPDIENSPSGKYRPVVNELL